MEEELVLGSGASMIWTPDDEETSEILSRPAPFLVHTCPAPFLSVLEAAFPKTEPVVWLDGPVWLESLVEYWALCRTQFSAPLWRKSREEAGGGGVGSGLGSGWDSTMMQSDSDPQSVSESDCSHTQGPGDDEVEDGWPVNSRDPRHMGCRPLPLIGRFDPDAPNPEYTPQRIVVPVLPLSSSWHLGKVGASNGDFLPFLGSRVEARVSWGRWALPRWFPGVSRWSGTHCFLFGWWGPLAPLGPTSWMFLPFADWLEPGAGCR